MNKDLEDIELIVRYLNGELSADEQAEFEGRLQADTALQQEVAACRDIALGVALWEEKPLREQLRKVEDSLEEEGFFFNDEHITAFLNGELPEEEAERLRRRMEGDPDFASHVEALRDLQQSLAQQAAAAAAREKLRGIEAVLEKEGFFGPAADEQAPPTGARLRPLYRRKWFAAVAAAASVLIVAAYFLLGPPSVNPYERLYAGAMEPDTALLYRQVRDLGLMGMATPDKERRQSLREGLLVVQGRQYGRAVELLRAHLAKYPEDDAARYYLAASLLQQEQPRKALKELEALGQGPQSEWRRRAGWYTALAYLQMERPELARPHLEGVAADDDNPFQQQARALLTKLK